MKKFLFLFVFLLAAFGSRATHNRAGEITYTYLGNNKYRVTITTYTRENAPADRCTLDLNWGDGTVSTLPRVNGTTNNGICPQGQTIGVYIGNDVRKNIYEGIHEYSSPGRYTISFEDQNRNADVANIPMSVNKPFYVSSELVVAPGIGINNSPILTFPPIDDGCVNRPFKHNPGAVDPDGDSLGYRLVLCREAAGATIPTTYDPNIVQGPVTINSRTGELLWASPKSIGQYNFAIEITEYRLDGNGNYVNIGYVVRDLQVTIRACNNRPPQIDPVGPFCVEAGQNLNFNVTATDPDSGPGPIFDDVTLSAFGEPYEVIFPADSLKGRANKTVTATFNWNTTCDHVKRLPYQVTFRAVDDPSKRAPFETSLVDLYTTEIQVVAPAPKNPIAQGTQNGIALQWDRSFCPQALGYKIYRREGSYGFIPSECETGVPAYTGYVLHDSTTHVDSTTYLDTMNVINGIQYCYMVIAYFEDGSESYASEEFCSSKNIDIPLITHADVLSTDPSNGKIQVSWVAPPEIDSGLYPPPYSYKLLRADEINGTTFITIASLAFSDTTFTDSLLNTQDLGYNYKVEFYSGTIPQPAAISNPASSVYLVIDPVDEANILRFKHFTPWINDTFVVYRENPLGSGIFDSIGVSFSNNYIDSGLVNGETYCYKALAIGGYTAPGTPRHLLNNSQIACGSPLDTTAPCAPDILVRDIDCENDFLRIEWDIPEDSACANDISYFNIYFKPTRDEAYPQQPWRSGVTDLYLELNGSTIVGCYAITAVDDAGNDPNGQANESQLSESICVPACPLINFPNVFTPNGDGYNDRFTAIKYKDVAELQIQVFNRWGVLVYESNSPNDFFENGWDGTDMNTGQACSDGVYYYVANFTPKSITTAEEQQEKGFVHLMR